jgi:dimethylamine monooxygenase subunit A
VAFLRDNWGLAATDQLNLHPSRRIGAPSPPVALDRLWLRVEHQALQALPGSGGIVFGIRIALHRLDRLAGTPAGERLRRGLETMPAELAVYKRLDSVRADVIRQL